MTEFLKPQSCESPKQNTGFVVEDFLKKQELQACVERNILREKVEAEKADRKNIFLSLHLA